jgi:hypothetical protein
MLFLSHPNHHTHQVAQFRSYNCLHLITPYCFALTPTITRASHTVASLQLSLRKQVTQLRSHSYHHTHKSYSLAPTPHAPAALSASSNDSETDSTESTMNSRSKLLPASSSSSSPSPASPMSWSSWSSSSSDAARFRRRLGKPESE